MLPSVKSLFTFVCLNFILVTISVILYLFTLKYMNQYFMGFLFMFLKNFLFVFGTEEILFKKNKNIANDKTKYTTEKTKLNLNTVKHIAYASFGNIVSYITIRKILNVTTNVNMLNTLLLFIPISFTFEVIFDFFHYWTHRTVHTYPILYQHIHKTHHESKKLTGIVTFQQDALDYILTNYIPAIISLFIVKYLLNFECNLFMYSLITIYKDFIEISGHIDNANEKSYSFPQFIWLPILFNMELYQKIHHNHHKYVTVNYSKRFSLWDKVFKTFKN